MQRAFSLGNLGRLALRDTILLIVTLQTWELHMRAPGSVGLGLAAGAAAAVCGFLFHEWGHLVGARLAGSVVHYPESVASVFLFRFDTVRNTGAQFHRMSMGGFAATAIAVPFLFWVLPAETLGRQVGLVLIALGVVATVILEFPDAWRVYNGGPMPRGAAFVSGGRDESV